MTGYNVNVVAMKLDLIERHQYYKERGLIFKPIDCTYAVSSKAVTILHCQMNVDFVYLKANRLTAVQRQS